MAIVLTMIESFLLVGASFLIAAWPWLLSWFGLDMAAAVAATVVKWLVVVLALLASFAIDSPAKTSSSGESTMARVTIADLVVDTLVAAGARRIYGVAGDSLNAITDAVRRRPEMRWVHVRHEEAGAFAAGAEAHLTGELAVCAGSSGPGHVHLINGLYDCHRSRVPVIAIAAHIPSKEIGTGYFQETQPEQMFRDCSHFCEMVSQPEQMPRLLDIAVRTALERRGVSVLILPGDVAQRLVEVPKSRNRGRTTFVFLRHCLLLRT
jgi:hypothetical protein